MLDNLKRAALVSVVGVSFVLGGMALAGPASADVASEIDAQFTSLKGDITGVYIPAILALVILGIGVMLGIKFLRKGANKA